MSLFGHLAASTIRTSADGRRMLPIDGPFARPYEVPGPDTEERIVRRLAWTYRVLTVLMLALLAFESPRLETHARLGGLAATLVVGWLIVRAFLHPELRRLRRVERPTSDGSSDDDFIRRLEPSDRDLLRRRRRFFLISFLVFCWYAILGFAMEFLEPGLGYFLAVCSGFCGVRLLMMFRLPPDALLQMRSAWPILMELPSGDIQPPTPLSGPREAGKHGFPPLLSRLWDQELDGIP